MQENKIICHVVFVLAYFWLALGVEARVCAETITLKTGKVITGDIVERGGDYIKVQTDSALLKIKNRMIDQGPGEEGSGQDGSGQGGSENGKVDVEAILEQLADQMTDEEWQKRLDEYTAYFKAMRYLQDQYMIVISESTKNINKAIANNDSKGAHQIAGGVLSRMDYIKKEMNKLNIYPELKPYHDKVLKAVDLTVEGIEAWQWGDQHVYYKYHRDSIRMMISSMEEFADFSRVVWTGNRSQDNMDVWIKQMKASLERLYY